MKIMRALLGACVAAVQLNSAVEFCSTYKTEIQIHS